MQSAIMWNPMIQELSHRIMWNCKHVLLIQCLLYWSCSGPTAVCIPWLSVRFLNAPALHWFIKYVWFTDEYWLGYVTSIDRLLPVQLMWKTRYMWSFCLLRDADIANTLSTRLFAQQFEQSLEADMFRMWRKKLFEVIKVTTEHVSNSDGTHR